jgi:hypothetical protein
MIDKKAEGGVPGMEKHTADIRSGDDEEHFRHGKMSRSHSSGLLLILQTAISSGSYNHLFSSRAFSADHRSRPGIFPPAWRPCSRCPDRASEDK